jgi:hypothetical protein
LLAQLGHETGDLGIGQCGEPLIPSGILSPGSDKTRSRTVRGCRKRVGKLPRSCTWRSERDAAHREDRSAATWRAAGDRLSPTPRPLATPTSNSTSRWRSIALAGQPMLGRCWRACLSPAVRLRTRPRRESCCRSSSAVERRSAWCRRASISRNRPHARASVSRGVPERRELS